MAKAADIAVVIPAAAPGRRMRSYGPKSLIPLADGRTVVRRQIDLVRQAWPHAEIVVVLGYDAERVVKTLPDGVRVVENERFDETGPGRSVAMGLRATAASRALVLYGDLVFNRAALDLPNESCVVVDTKGRMGDADVGVTVVNGSAVHFDYGLHAKWVPIVLLTGRELHLFKAIGSNRDKRKLLGFEVLNEIVDRGGHFRAVENPKMTLVEIDHSRDIARAKGVA